MMPAHGGPVGGGGPYLIQGQLNPAASAFYPVVSGPPACNPQARRPLLACHALLWMDLGHCLVLSEGAVSSPGLMSDVAGSGSADASFCAGYPSSSSGGRIQSPPGLPLTDPPRVTGAYGVPAYDPDFGLGSRGEAVEPKASIPPPPPRDPYVQLLESQSAMSMLMMQMAREMNQRSQQLLQHQQQPLTAA